jgi:hypothetical protein
LMSVSLVSMRSVRALSLEQHTVWPSSSPIQVLLNKLNKSTQHVVIHWWWCHVAPFWEEKILDLHTHSIMVVAMHFRLLFFYQDKKGIGVFVMGSKIKDSY